VKNHTQLHADEDYSLDSAIIHLANIMVLQDEQKKTGFIAPPINPSALQLIEIPEQELEQIKIEAKKNMVDILKLLFAN
jgi:hypothetical protein